MAHTTTIVGNPPIRVVGSRREVTVDVAWTSAYATGGENITTQCGNGVGVPAPAPDLPLSVVNEVVDATIIAPVAASTAVEAVCLLSAFVGQTVRLKLNTAAAEVANAVDVTGLTVRMTVRGK